MKALVGSLITVAMLVACGGSSGPAADATPTPVASPTPDAVTQSYVALIKVFWADEQAADGVSPGVNIAAQACLGKRSAADQSEDTARVDAALCGQRAALILAAQQKFLTALATTPAPPQFASDDQALRTQLPKTIADIKAIIAAAKTGSKAAVHQASDAYVNDMVPLVTDALDHVDPSTAHY